MPCVAHTAGRPKPYANVTVGGAADVGLSLLRLAATRLRPPGVVTGLVTPALVTPCRLRNARSKSQQK